MERKLKLIEELKKEAERLRKQHLVTIDHQYAIEYLETGKLPMLINIEEYDILNAAVNDYECLLSDYGA
jgi:hypothetical protein